jgi:putative sigma-54 modulation protein
MQTQITARHFNASPRLRRYASERLGKLERFYDGISDAHVILEPNGDPTSKEAKVELNVFRQRLTAADHGTTYEQAIDKCVNRLRRQILKYKSKRKDPHKKGPLALDSDDDI